jgi:hypothetical protein
MSRIIYQETLVGFLSFTKQFIPRDGKRPGGESFEDIGENKEGYMSYGARSIGQFAKTGILDVPVYNGIPIKKGSYLPGQRQIRSPKELRPKTSRYSMFVTVVIRGPDSPFAGLILNRYTPAGFAHLSNGSVKESPFPRW